MLMTNQKRRLLFIANLGHSEKSLTELWKTKSGRNITELYGSSTLPMGAMSIESYVKGHCENVDTVLLDLNADFIKRIQTGDIETELEYCVTHFQEFLEGEICGELEGFRPDVVAISSLFDKSISTLLKLAEIVKDFNSNILVIAGGHPANNMCEYILNEGEQMIDAISMGEGEIPFRELMESADLQQYLLSSDYFLTLDKYRHTGKSGVKQTYIWDLDEIPMFDYEGYMKRYGEEVLGYHNNVLDSEHSFNRQASIMTSRGCPYNCIFCASGAIHGKKFRKYSMERVKEEIDYWVDEKKVQTIGLMDDHLLYDVDRAIEICDYAGSKGVDIRFPNGLAIAPITKELVECMVRNHVKEVQLALESGSERVLHEIIRKPLSLQKADEVFGYFKQTDIFVKVYLVIGLPGETEEDVEDALRYLRTADFHWCTVSNATPISGSRLWQESMKLGVMDEYDFDNVSFFKSTYMTPDKYNGDIRYTVNLDVNFVHNGLMRMGRYDEAKKRFESVLKNYPNHAFAYYYVAQCKKKMGEDSAFEMEQWSKIVAEDAMWHMYADYFGLQ